MFSKEIVHYQKVQNAACYTLFAVLQFIIPGACEAEIVKKTNEIQLATLKSVDNMKFDNSKDEVERTTFFYEPTPPLQAYL